MLVRALANADGGFFLARSLDELADAADDPVVRIVSLAADDDAETPDPCSLAGLARKRLCALS